ncbi:MAG: phage holin family protein [Clostridia bacterium]|nr:phage holin family protein [Clostridia bacterium]
MRKLMGIVVSLIAFAIGDFDLMLKILLCVVACDYITGIMSAIYNKKLSSRIGFNGILKKLCILSIICLSNLAGEAVGIGEIRFIAISFYIGNEAISILENAGEMGVPFPQKLLEILQQLENK